MNATLIGLPTRNNIKTLKKVLHKNKWSQSYLAQKMNVDRSTVGRWLRGDFDMSAADIALMESFLPHNASPAQQMQNTITQAGDYGIVKIDGAYKMGRLQDFTGRLKIDTAGVTLVFLEEKK